MVLPTGLLTLSRAVLHRSTASASLKLSPCRSRLRARRTHVRGIVFGGLSITLDLLLDSLLRRCVQAQCLHERADEFGVIFLQGSLFLSGSYTNTA